MCIVIMHIHAHAQELFLQANEWYEHGAYDKAIEAYTILPEKGFGVYFNMGNAYYKKGDLIQALIHWKKAQRLAYGSSLEKVLKQVAFVQKELHINDTNTEKIMMHVGPYVSYIPMLAVQFFWFLLLCMMMYMALCMHGYKRVLYAFLLVIACATVGGIYAIKRALQLPACAIVHNKEASLYVGPNSQYHAIASLVPGNQVSICQQTNNWCKISCGNIKGWIPSIALVVI